MIDLNPLANYLQPRFGYIDDSRPWASELRSAISRFLRKLPRRSLNALMREAIGVENEDTFLRGELESLLLSRCSPAELISATHWMAVRTASSLEELAYALVGHDVTEAYFAAAEWLDENATAQERASLIRELDPAYFFIESEIRGKVPYIVDWLEATRESIPAPADLLDAWERVVG